ncbi:MAG: carboxypeptidase-like regulatory domain-containing protein [Acidobacteriota bacterium]
MSGTRVGGLAARGASRFRRAWAGAALAPLLFASAASAVPHDEALAAWAASLPAVSAADSAGDHDLERSLVGLVLHEREEGALDVIHWRGELYLPLESLIEVIGASLDFAGDVASVRTPLGTVAVPAGAGIQVDGEVFVASSFWRRDLATPVRFDEGRFAVVLDLPWRRGSRAGPVARRDREPDITAPDHGLSELRLHALWTGDDRDQSLASSLEAGGRLGGGLWRGRFSGDLSGGGRLEDFTWLRPFGRHRLQLGHQRLDFHPLLPSLELTGAQWAWSNGFGQAQAARRGGDLLIPRRVTPSSSFEGRGIPAGIAELWVDDRLVARQVVPLDGIYRFEDVRLQDRLNRVEVRVFDRHRSTVPASVDVYEQRLSSQLLPAGGTTLVAGLGAEGHLADRRNRAGGAGFVHGRRGSSLLGRSTFELALSRQRGVAYALAGGVASLGPSATAAFSVASNDRGAGALSFDLDGERNGWRFLARSRVEEARFRPGDAEAFEDHLAEVEYRPSERWSFGLVGRYRRDGSAEPVRFVLPTFRWTPGGQLALRGCPDRNGDYRFDLRYRPTASVRLSARVLRRTSLAADVDLSPRSRVLLGVDFGDGQDERYSLAYARHGSGTKSVSWSAGPVYSGGELGFRGTATAALGSSILARVLVERERSVDSATDDPSSGWRFSAGLTADLGVAGGRLVPADRFPVREGFGGIGGALRLDGHRAALDGATLLVDGRPLGRSELGGTFFIGGLEPGVYAVELDMEDLPIELQPLRRRFQVEVAEGAVTRVDFELDPRYGVAGRVLDLHGEPHVGVTVEIVDGTGQPVSTAVTDRFGLFRLDGLPRGTYTLRSRPGADRLATAERLVVVDDQFLFGQDLSPEAPYSG